MGPDTTCHVDHAAGCTQRAPAARGCECGAEGPSACEWVEDHGVWERRCEVVGGAGEEDEVAGDGD